MTTKRSVTHRRIAPLEVDSGVEGGADLTFGGALMAVQADGSRSQRELLIEAAQARHEANMLHNASLIAIDGVVQESLAMRAAELHKLAAQLGAKAAEMTPSADKENA